MKHFVLMALFAVSAPFFSHGGVAEKWVKRYNGVVVNNDQARALALDSGGNVVVTGVSDNGFYTAKYSPANGALMWERWYSGGHGYDDPSAVAADAAGNVIVTGYSASTNGPPTYNYDFYTAKYAAADGSLVWERLYNGTGNDDDGPVAIAVDSGGNVIVTGISKGPQPSNGYDYYTAKYAAADGAVVWEKRYNGASNSHDQPTALVVDGFGDAIVTGWSVTTTGTRAYTVKYAGSTGALIWEKFYTDPLSPFADVTAKAAALDTAGNVVIAGRRYAASNTDMYVAKYAAATGGLLWEKVYDGPAHGDDTAAAVAVDAAGNVIVTGSSSATFDAISPDCLTAKFAAGTGALLWERRYNGPANSDDSPVAIGVDGAGNVAITALSWLVTSPGDTDYYTAKYASADGAIIWESRYDGTAGHDYDAPAGLAITPGGDVVVTGISSNAGTGDYDFLTIFYAEVPPPAVATTAPGGVSTTAVTLNGTVNPNGLATTAQFEYGPTASYGSMASVTLSPNNGNGAQAVSATLTGLTPGSLYHYRLIATSSGGAGTTADATFQTLDPGGSSAASGWPVVAPAGSGVGDDEGQGVAVDTAGNVAVVGSKTNASGDFYVAKYSPTGALIWQVTYDNPTYHGQDIGRAVAFDPGGNVVVTGQTYNGSSTTGGTEIDVYTAKYAAADGVRLWERTYNNPLANSDDRGFCVLVDANGDVIVGGYTFRASGNQDYYTAKYAGATGAVVWQTNYNGSANGSDIASSLALDSSGNVVVTGNSANASGNADYATLKYAGANGGVLWEHRYNGPANQNDYAYGVSVEPSGRVFVAGESQNADGSYDMHTLKIGSGTGSTIWERRFNGGANLNDTAYRVLPDAVGDVFVIGMTTTAPGNQDFYTAKYAGATGALIWERTYNGPGNAEDVPTQLLVASNGDALVTGYSRAGDVDYLTVRYRGSDGFPLNTARTQGPGSGGDFPASAFRGAALLPSGWPVVTGKGIGLSGEFEIMTVAYAGPPEVQTTAATNVLAFTATLNGWVNPTGVSSTAWFEYGTTTGYGTSTTAESAGSGLLATARTANVTGLSHSTLYHYRVAAQNINGTSYGPDMTFTTPAAVPEIRVFAGADDTAPELTDGQATPVDFGSTPLGTAVTRSFTVKNVGNTSLHITGMTWPTTFDLQGNLAALDSIPPLTSATFQVRFLANTVHGTFSGNLSIANDDGDEGVFDVHLVGTATYSPTVTEQWVNRRNNPGTDYVAGTAVDAAGNVVVTGSVWNGSPSFRDYYTAKYAAADGALLWEKIYSGPNSEDQARAVAVDGAGNVTVTGSSRGMGTLEDYYTAKYAAADGAMLWETRYNGPGNGDDRAHKVIVDGDGNVLVTGSSWNGSNADYYTAKYAAADGALLWERRHNGPANRNDHAYNLAVDSAGNIAVTGVSYDVNGYSDYFTVKYAAASGAILWERRYNGPGNRDDEAYDLAVDDNGNVVVTGMSHGSLVNKDYYTAKYADADGALLWERRYDANGQDEASSVAVDGVGDVVVTGSILNTSGYLDYYTVKYASADGAMLWEKFYNGPGNSEDRAFSVALDVAGNVAVTGQSHGSTGNLDYYTAKYSSSNGALLWERRYNGPANGDERMDQIFPCDGKLALTGDGGAVVTGISYNGTDFKFATLRYGFSSGTPMVVAAPATAVELTDATLNGTVNPNGVITSAWFEYGTTTSYGQTTAIQPQGYGTSANPVSAAINDLIPNTLYHYRLVAQNGETTAYGADMTFTTLTMQQGWRQQHFGTTNNSGNAADTFDFDKDGLVNLIEWALDMNPTTASILPVTTIRSGAFFEFTYTRSVAALNAGAIFTVEWSDTLPGTSWSSVGVTEQILSDNGTVQQVKALVPVGSQGRRFAHLKVTAPP